MELLGDLTLSSSSNNSVNGGTATFLFDGTGNQTISSAQTTIDVGVNERMTALPNVEINKVSGSLNLVGLISLNGTSWKTTAGANLINPGTSTINIISSITFTGQNLSLYNVHIWANSQNITLSPASYKLTCTHDLTINGGSYYQLSTGILELLGDLNLLSTSTSALNGGTGTFLFDGAGVQNIVSSATGLVYSCALPGVEINKTSGSLNFYGIINFAGGSWNTVAGASLVNTGLAVFNLLRNCTISGQNLSMYDIVITGNNSITTISSGVMWTCTHLLTLAGGSSWFQLNTGTLNAQGDILVTNTNTSNSGGGSATLLIDGAANQTLTGSGTAAAGRLPQVQINKSGGKLTLASIISTNNNWTYIAGTVDASTNASTVDFYNTSVIDGQGTSGTMSFYNVIFSGFISLGGNLDVNGDFTIRSGVNNRLDVNAASNYQVNVAGNWINNNSATLTSFNQQSGKVVFDGVTAQQLTLASTANTETFYNLELNNSGAGITLNAPVSVSNMLTFGKGILNTSTSNLLVISNGASVTGGNNTSFVSGPVRKTGNQAFTFPIGKNTVYAPISISAPGVNTDQFTAEYVQGSPNTLYPVTSKDVSLDHLSTAEYWTLDRTTGTSNVSVSLSWDTRSKGITNISDLRVARWNGTQWKDHGNGGTSGNTTAGTLVSSAAITSFSPFTLGSAGGTNPLPIELITFEGSCENNATHLNWTTASEHNNNYFTVEHSNNGVNWEVVDTIMGKNKLFMSSYSLSDQQASLEQLNYYRLKQTDFDGSYTYSEIIEVKPCTSAPADVLVYPNPSSGRVYFHANKKEAITAIDVFNSTGEKIYSGPYTAELPCSQLKTGIYFIHFKMMHTSIVKKLVLCKDR